MQDPSRKRTHVYAWLPLISLGLILLLNACTESENLPGTEPAVTITSPAAGASVPVGPVTVAFAVQNHTIGNPGTSHLHFYLDTDATAYHFYGGSGINDDNGVLYNGVHTHFVHWKSATSFDVFGLPSTAHTVRLVLADQNHNELANTEATKTLNFSVNQPPIGDLQLQPVLTGLNALIGLGVVVVLSLVWPRY